MERSPAVVRDCKDFTSLPAVIVCASAKAVQQAGEWLKKLEIGREFSISIISRPEFEWRQADLLDGGSVCFWYESEDNIPLPETFKRRFHYRGSLEEIATEWTRIDKAIQGPAIRGLLAPEPDLRTELAIAGIYRTLGCGRKSNLEGYSQPPMRRRLAREMMVAGVASLEDYAERLKNSATEKNRLFSAITANCGGRFREPSAFVAVSSAIGHLLRPGSVRKRFRAWVPGCSTGEEVFQLAIALLEGLGWKPGQGDPRIEVLGTDIHQQALDAARLGSFDSNALQSLHPAYIDRHFVRKEDRLEIIPEIRRLCSFREHNVVSNSPIEPVDFICCQNLLKLFGAETLQRLIPMLHHSLRRGGFLMLGAGEMVSAVSAAFTPFNTQANLFRKAKFFLETKPRVSGLEEAIEELRASNRALADQVAAQHDEIADFETMLGNHPVPMILVDQFERVKKFSAACEGVFGLRPQDAGKPASALWLGKVSLGPIIAGVLRDGQPREEALQDSEGKWKLLRILTAQNETGRREAMVTTIDTDRATRAETGMMEARAITQSVLEGSPVPTLILDENLRIGMANRVFLNAYRMKWLEVQWRYFPEFATSKWDCQDLRGPLKSLLEGGAGTQWDGDLNGARTIRLHARTFLSHAHPRLMIVMEDITEQLDSRREHKRLLSTISEKDLTLKRTVAAFRALSERQINTQEDERRRVARELHDDLGQKLALLQFEINALANELGVRSPAKRQVLQHLDRSVSRLTNDLRNIAHQVHPSILDDLGLSAAIQVLADEFRESSGLPIRLHAADFPRAIPASLATCLYRIAQEALRNVTKHAGPTQVDIRLSASESRVRLEIRDYGNGFDLRMDQRMRSLGMLAMKERARLLKGTLIVRSRPMQGVTIVVGIPLGAEERRDLAVRHA